MTSPSNSGLDGVAVYAAIVATGGLLWQAFTWWRSQAQVILNIDTGAWPEDPENEEDPNYIQVLAVTVLNRSQFPIRVMGAGAGPARVINTEGPLQQEGMTKFPDAVVAAYDAVDIFFDWQQLDYMLGKKRRVRVSVYLSTGKVVRKYFSDEVSSWGRLWQWLRRRIRDARRNFLARKR